MVCFSYKIYGISNNSWSYGTGYLKIKLPLYFADSVLETLYKQFIMAIIQSSRVRCVSYPRLAYGLWVLKCLGYLDNFLVLAYQFSKMRQDLKVFLHSNALKMINSRMHIENAYIIFTLISIYTWNLFSPWISCNVSVFKRVSPQRIRCLHGKHQNLMTLKCGFGDHIYYPPCPTEGAGGLSAVAIQDPFGILGWFQLFPLLEIINVMNKIFFPDENKAKNQKC